jgi:hypothetical protein
LEGRLPATPGGTDYQAYYDPNLGITWAANADIGFPASYDLWDNHIAGVAGLNIGGVTGWRLPSADVNGDGTVVDCFGGRVAGCADNEMGYLYWEESITGSNPGPFSNIWFSSYQNLTYYSGTEYSSIEVWDFNFFNGNTSGNDKWTGGFAWAVHDGDVGVVPIPAAAWLFGTGLIGLVGIASRKVASH